MISFQQYATTAMNGVILMDARGKVTMFNQACERIFGYAAAEVVGEDFKRLIPKPYPERPDQTPVKARRKGGKKIVVGGRQVDGLRKSGEIFPMDLSLAKVEGDEEVAYVGILSDVSEQVRAQEQRERLLEQLAKSNAELTHFVHAASHDLREPMRMIRAFCGRLAKDYTDRLDRRGAEYLSLVVSASERLHLMLDDLLEFASLSHDPEPPSIFEANIVVDRVVDSLSKTLEPSDADITRGDLPRLNVNPTRFERLMQNLIGNARKYVAPNTRPQIRIEAAREGDFWRFSVSDNGIGVNPRDFERIFQPFTRLRTDGRYEGAGLGLTICRKIVESFGGAIAVSSSEGQGSTFSFTVPVDPQANRGASDDA